MEGLEDALLRFRYFLDTIGHAKSFILEHRWHLNSLYYYFY